DLDGNIIYLNTAARKMIGLSHDREITQLNIRDIIPSETFEQTYPQAIATAIEQGYWQGESSLVHHDGHEIPVSQVVITNNSTTGEANSISTIIRDITEQKEQEEQIRVRLELSQALEQAETEAEVIDALTTKAGYYHSSAIGFTKREIIDGEIFDVVTTQFLFDENLQGLPVGTPIQNAPAILQTIERNEPFITNDFLNDKRLPRKLAKELTERTGQASLGVIPIFLDENIRYGNLVIASSVPNFFTPLKTTLYQALAEQANISIKGVKLTERIQQSLERRSRQVQITTQIAQEIASATEIYELYQRVVDLIKEEFGYYHTQLLQYNPALDAVALVVGYGEVGQKMLEMGHSLPLGTGLIGTAASTGSSVLQSDVSQDPNWRPNTLLPETCSELAVPIKFRNQVLGVLDIQSNVLGQLAEEDQIMLEGLCGQIAIAIESTRLRQDMNERLQELNNLQRLMTREGWQSFQSGNQQQTVGYLFDHNNVQPLSQTKNGGSNGASTPIQPIQIENGQIITNPISVRGEVIGTLGLEESSDKPLSKDEQDLLDAISLQVAEALENARLIEQTRKRAIELETVARVSADTSTILEAEALLKSVVNLTQASFGLYHAHIYLFDDTERNLRLAAGTGEVGELMVAENWQIPLHEEYSIVSRVARARRGMVVADIRQELGYRPNPLMPETKAELVAPMIAGDEILGVLDLHSSTIGFFTQEDLRIHTTLATQVAVALQNANLYQEQLETAEKLREFDRLKSQFLASMSHELRTPLNSIIGFADVLLEGIDGELNERMREDVLLIRDGGQHLRALIGDILDMSKIEAGMMDLTYSNLEIPRIAHEVMATTQGLITEKPIELLLTMDSNLTTIEADRTRLVQILLNLLSNAAKFTDEGEIELSLKADGDYLLVGVRDSGIGIKEEDIGQVFEQFRQIGGMEHRKAGGTGLGMPITKQLVELHGGKIWIESVYEQGSTFWFTIPFERPADLENKRDGYYA
ncbi:MAG: GAF domain-containing protein, partial [Anaerolineales bacterium]|nr:GAF domain-containing protein [Anaerolineales bacterium]